MISHKEDLVIFSDAACKAQEGNSIFQFVMTLNDVIVNADVIQGPNVTTSKVAKTRVVLVAL